MSKPIIIVIGFVLAIGAGVLVFNNRKAQAPSLPTSERSASQSSTNAQNRRKDSLRNLMASGHNLSCAVSISNQENGAMEGMVYLAGQKMRGEFTAKAEGREVQTHMINKDGFSYNWSSLAPQGVKTKIEASDKNSDTTEKGADIDREVDVDCKDWSVDEKKFEVPDDIKFMENTMMPTGTPTLNSAACENLPDAASKAACKAAFGN